MIAAKWMLALAGTLALPAAAQAGPAEIGYPEGALGYAAMVQGDTDTAITQLEASESDLRNDPARLINLGTAYSRAGRYAEAATAYRTAMASNAHFDIVLSDGRVVSTRLAAGEALRRLEGRFAAAE